MVDPVKRPAEEIKFGQTAFMHETDSLTVDVAISSVSPDAAAAAAKQPPPDIQEFPENDGGVDLDAKPWWIDFMREEGLLEDDTSTIFKQDGSIVGAEDLAEEGATAKEVAKKDEKEKKEDDDDDSVDDEAEDDWKERLWVVSRNHWNYDYKEQNSASRNENPTAADEAEMALLQATVDEDRDQEQILSFRNQLLGCLVAYIQVFGDIEAPVNTDAPRKRSALRAEATQMSPHVPLNVVRRLFVLVLKTMNSKASETDKANDDDDDGDPSPRREVNDKFYYVAEHVTQVLFSPEMNVFRTYMVEARSKVDIAKKGELQDGKRVRTDRIADDRQRQRDTERLIYGDMYADEKKDDVEKMEVEDIDPDCPEEEVRIRRRIATTVAQLANVETLPGHETDWTLPFVREVLLNGFLLDSLSDNPISVSNFLSSRVDQNKATSLAYMYAIRYFPHFYVRSSWSTTSSSDTPPSLALVTQYFRDPRLIRNRLVVLGIYNGVMVHVGELDALFKELKSLDSFDETSWDDFYREVHRSIEECLSTVLEENMRTSDFLPSKTIHGIDWKVTDIKDNPSFRIEKDHPQIVSVCIEIGRSFHFQGVTLGTREQERLSKKIAANAVLQKRNFDDRVTELEVDAYLEAQSAYQGALKVLKRAEGTIKDMNLARIQEAAAHEDDDALGPKLKIDHKLDPLQTKVMKHINEARVTIELYLADTLTTLAYCYEAKLSEFPLALKWYNDSLALYARHVGKDHPTVLHALQSLGVIHIELMQWKDAARCFGECLELMKRRLPPNAVPALNGVVAFPSQSENTDMSVVLKCMGVVRSKLGDHDVAFDSLSKSIDQMTLTVLQTKGHQASITQTGVVGPPNDPFICDALSKMVAVLFTKLASLKTAYAKRRLAMLYGEEEDFDIEALDSPRLTRLQVERKAVEIARDAVSMRKTLLFGDEDGRIDGPSLSKRVDGIVQKPAKWFELLDLMVDLSSLGKLYFRRCDYDDAVKCWTEALDLMDNAEKSAMEDSQLSRAVRAALRECQERKIDCLGELAYLIGIASCRIGRNDAAIIWFEKSLLQLEEKRKVFSDREAEKGRKGPSDENWDILDMDVGYCEHALGLAHFYNNKLTPATAHYRESLRLFEAVAARRKGRQSFAHQGGELQEDKPAQQKSDQKKVELDIFINSAIAGAMLSLGVLYHEQQKNDRARRFLEGAIQIVYSTTHRILSSPRGTALLIPSVTGFSDLSLIVSVVRVGDAHRRIAIMNLQKKNIEEARFAFETSMRCLESTNLETRLSLSVDDETHLESVGQNEIDEMLMSCCEHMMTMLESHDEQPNSSGQNWWGFGGRNSEETEAVQEIAGLTREDLLFRLGNISAKRGSFDSAIRCFFEARELTEDRLGTPDHAIVGNILFNLGNVYKKVHNGQSDKVNQKARERAIDSFVESLRITKLTSGPDSLAAAEVMEALASVLMTDEGTNPEERNYTDDDGATSFLRDAVAIRNQHRSEMNLPYAQSMHHLGLLRLRQQLQDVDDEFSNRDDKKLDEAISCLSQALRVRRVLLGDHLDVANSASCLGVALWKRAISPSGSKHATVNDAMKQLSDALFIRTSFLERSNREDTKPKPKDHRKWRQELDGTADIGSVIVKTVENMHDIARVHESQRNFDAQRTCLNNALGLMQVWTERLSSDENLDERSVTPIAISARSTWKAKVYYGLGVSWFEVGDFSKAVSELEKSLKFRGLDSIETATSDEVFDNFFRQQPDEQPRARGADHTSLASAIAMEKLAFAYDKMKKYEDALRCFSFCLRVYGEHFGHSCLKIAAILRHVGRVYQDRHDYKRCVRALQRALHIRDSVDGGDYVPRVEDALVYLQLARSLMALGAYDEVALDHFHSAVGVLEDVNQIVQSRSATKKSLVPSKSTTDLPEDGLVEGVNTYELLLEGYSAILVLLRRQEKESDDESEENISEVLHHIGNTQAALRQYEKALKSLSHVLEFQRNIKGNEHLSIADLLFNLGNIHVELGQIPEARECHHECHAISAAVLGNDSIELAENMMCLGNIEFLDTNFPFALEWFDEALRLLKKKGEYEVAVAKCLHRKAVAHDKLGEYDKSIDCFGEVLRLGRNIWGMNHIELSNILNSVGNVHRNRGEIRRALKCYEESLRIRIRAGAELNVANTKNNIGALFMSMDHTDRARQFYAEALRIKTDLLGPNNIETSRTLYNMGQLYVADKKYEKGLRFFSEGTSNRTFHFVHRIFTLTFPSSSTSVQNQLWGKSHRGGFVLMQYWYCLRRNV
jgi:tetratricopeptide (TPR) repeat protein